MTDNNNLEPSELMADEGLSQSVGQTPRGQATESLHISSPDPRQPALTTDECELQQTGAYSFQLEFQDSNLSPALALLPVSTGVEHNLTEYSFFHHSDNEFAPLSAYPDISVTSERFHAPSQEWTTHAFECGTLSQHSLTQATGLSEERESSCCSLSQHSLSPGGESQLKEISYSPIDKQGAPSRVDTGSDEKDFESSGKIVVKATEDETFFLSKDVPAHQLLDRLQKDIGMLSSSSAISSASGMSVTSTASLVRESKSANICEPGNDQSIFRREGPPGEAPLPQQQTHQPDICTPPKQSQTLSPEVCNITMGSRSTQPDDTTEALHKELLAEAERHSTHEDKHQKSPTPTFTPNPTEISEDKLRLARTNLGGVPWTCAFSASVTRVHHEQDPLFLGDQTGIDGSYLGFLPQSKSTPGAFNPTPKSSVKTKLGQLSVVESDKENSFESSTGTSPQPTGPVAEDHSSDMKKKGPEEATSAKVQSLPSVNYMQKVDAWRSNQSSAKMSLFDSLAMQGFSGISPKKKAYHAVSDTLNHILSQQVKSLQQPKISSAAGQTGTHTSSTVISCSSSPSRGEAVGSSPNDKDNTVSVAQTGASPFGRSQSHSSHSTVVMLGQKDQKTLIKQERYAPYWTSELSTPPPQPRLQELNIEDRIPLYLHNLGIDQSPSTILTPFVPRGPIREPEFSPTELCTIRGSTATPTKSTQPSEGGSPHKAEFSRSSILSVDSSTSIPLCLDSLGPAISIPDQITCRSSSDTEAIQIAGGMPSCSQSDEGCHVSILHSGHSSLTSNQNAVQLGQKFVSDVSLGTNLLYGERNIESPLQTSRSLNQSAEDSIVSSKALREIHTLLSQAENVVSTRSCAVSSTSAAVPCVPTDCDVFVSRTQTDGLEDSLLSSSSAAENPRTHSSFLVTRSSSDSMLTSEEARQTSFGRNSMISSWKQSSPSTQSLSTGLAPLMGTHGGSASLVLSKPTRRTEPEGCSAVLPDGKIQTQPAVIKPLLPVNTQQLSPTPSDTVGAPEEEQKTKIGNPAHSGSSSLTVDDTDQGVVSDGSSEGSLLLRVAKLLQSESPSTKASSSNSVADQEENKDRAWLKLKIPGQQYEPVMMGKEDRERIEEIKTELLLERPVMSQGSTDTESGEVYSVGLSMRQDLHQPVQTFLTFSNVPNNQPMEGFNTDCRESSVQLQHRHQLDLEARIHEIAAREKVALPRTHPRALTSITIATRKRSTSSSPSASPVPPLSPAPEPLHLAELSTGSVEHPKAHRQLPLSQDENSRTPREASLEPSSLSSKNESPLSSAHLHREDVNKELSVQDSSASDGHRAEQATGLTTSESPSRTGHVTRVHFTMSPKATDDRQAIAVHSSHVNDVSELPRKEFVAAANSPYEGVGLSSPAELFDTRKQLRQQTNSSTRFNSTVLQGASTSTSTQSFTPRYRPEHSPGHLTTLSPAVPVLLPYKPRGSEELFYVPQTEAYVSSTGLSDTTMESSHTGSDDAVPPRFSSNVLGHSNPGLDRGVGIRHTEGIYSKRFKTAAFIMQQPKPGGASVAADESETCESQVPKPSSHVSVAFTRVPLPSTQEASTTNQGTSPVQFYSYNQPDPSNQAYQPVHVEMDCDRTSPHLNQNFIPNAGGQQIQQSRDPVSQQSGLDQLWQRFCQLWSLEESRPTTDREASQVERLERLFHLIHNMRAADLPEQGEVEMRRQRAAGGEKQAPRANERRLHYEAGETERNVRESRRVEDDLRSHTGRQRPRVEKSQPVGDSSPASLTSSVSRSSFQSQHLCPADRDGTDTLSSVSGSMSTVDTARLIRVFGAHRVQHLKSSPRLSKIYSTINNQKEGREQRRGRTTAPPDVSAQSETTGTDESVAADSASSTSPYMLPSHRGPSRSLAARKAVKLVSKGIQAGDLEIVSNGTRRHTRDVGTTFPSPGETKAQTRVSSSSISADRRTGEPRNPSKSQGSQKQRKSKRSPSKRYPEGVSWFISADELRSEVRKENQSRDELSARRPSAAWFEPYATRQPWREPLRQRQVHEDINRQPAFIHHAGPDPEPRTKTTSSGLARVSLQEALEMQRPDFISQSTQRMRRLALQVEERKLKPKTKVFTAEEDELFRQAVGLGRWPRPGTARLRRAVPRKEMIQRSKGIYENLPEVQRKREEEKRKAEYQSYRLNAKLYNKRITNRVLGRRSAWQ
ncbi:hypothetical protein Q5P01_020919 [Channa striata]|uniref:ALMS motif domain-containing protein n=1 Tax=Channa striata TaxID=64152 RepID=A0AA88S9J0_CHASR|nr:hypothetical protein Q5P01_020919 [Channa striata]